MELTVYKIKETSSTNDWLRKLPPDDGIHVAVAEHQTAGRGQKGNRWESAPGKNLLFSILLHPRHLHPSRQFALSEAISLAVVESAAEASGLDGSDFTVKWPNDIYWKERKLAGILIENTICTSYVDDSIIGVGLNVNQEEFLSDAPNPVSLYQLCGQVLETDALLQNILRRFIGYLELTKDGITDKIQAPYMARLFRREGMHKYRDSKGEFMARINKVDDNGLLTLEDSDGCLRTYEFKQVSYVLNPINK